MKKILSLVLCMLMVISAFSGCAAQQPGESTGATNPETTAPKLDHVLQVGYGRADATPRVSIPLGGSANSVVGGASTDRMSSSVKNPLYVTCVALTDETGNTILLYHLDLLFSFAGTLVNAKMAVAKAKSRVPAATTAGFLIFLIHFFIPLLYLFNLIAILFELC